MDDADVIEQCFASGAPNVEVMFRVRTAAQVRDVHKRFAPKTIQVNISNESESLSDSEKEAIRTALSLKILVETHANNSIQQTNELIDAGVRMLHTNKPDAVRQRR